MSEEEEESYENSPDQGRRIGSWGVAGGAPPIDEEEIPDFLFEDALFWIGRYYELEKAYMDIGQIMESYRQDQRGRSFIDSSRSEYKFEKSFNRIRNSVGVFSSTLAILWSISETGLIDPPFGLIFIIALALVTIFDAVDLQGLLARVPL